MRKNNGTHYLTLTLSHIHKYIFFMGSTDMSDFTGVVMPIVAEVTQAQHPHNGTVYATGKLGEIAVC